MDERLTRRRGHAHRGKPVRALTSPWVHWTKESMPTSRSGPPGDYVGDHGTGSVTILRGSPSGLTTSGTGGRRLHPGVRGIAGSVQHAGAFGTGLAVAFVQGGSRGDLIIGEPYARVRGIRAGRIHQLAMTKNPGQNPIGSSNFHLDTHGLKGTPAKRDFFGYTVH